LWRKLDLQLLSWDKATDFSLKKSKITKTEKGETGEEQSRAAHHFLWHQGDGSQRICPVRPKSQFHILLGCFTVTEWECVKTSPRTLARKELSVASQQRNVSHFFPHQGIFNQKQHDCPPPPHAGMHTERERIDSRLKWKNTYKFKFVIP
jgi:hypothetical protein